MKGWIFRLLTLLASLSGLASPALAEWEVMKVEAQVMKEQTGPTADFWLEITIQNRSATTVYVQGIRPGWYMVESFVKDAKGQGWTRQNIGVDRDLEMLPVAPQGTIKVTHRESKAHVGRLMMLTFLASNSELDAHGSTVLVGEFKIPQPQ